MKSTLSLVTILCLIATHTFAQSVSLDSSFGVNGIVTTDIPQSYSYLSSMVIQNDGKLLVCGQSFNTINRKTDLSVTRYLSNGSIDSGFGVNGFILVDSISEGNAIALQKDGKILAGGGKYYQQGEGSYIYKGSFKLVRLYADGKIDSSFGVDGIVTDTFSKSAIAIAIAVQDDGKIVVSGGFFSEYSGPPAVYYGYIVRYQVNGERDSSFGDDGKVELSDTYPGNNLIIQSDHKIVFSVTRGYFIYECWDDFCQNSLYETLGVRRFNSNGTPDSSFNEKTGYGMTLGYGGSYQSLKTNQSSSCLQADGSILVTGASTTRMYLEKFKPSGFRDSSFGVNGVAVTSVRKDKYHIANCQPNAITVQKDQKIILAGQYNGDGFIVSIFMARYHPDGTLDRSFGDTGILIQKVGQYSWASSMQLSDNKIYVAGTTYPEYSPQYQYNTLLAYKNEIVLPITLQNFTGLKQNSAALLSWQTKSEQNNNYFSVQRSMDGSNFYEIGSIKSKGNSSLLQQYNFTDYHPKTGINYYRLKQTDNDGHFAFSPIVKIDFSEKAIITIEPNPVQHTLIIKGLGKTNNLSIIDALGNRRSTAISVNDIYTWDIQYLSSGFYYLIVEENGKHISTLKFFKQ